MVTIVMAKDMLAKRENGERESTRDGGLLLGISLGLLSLLGPLAIDLYLAAMPRMTVELQAGSGSIQRTLSAFFLGLAIAQIPVGFLGDRFGRKSPLVVGLLCFAIASASCALVGTIDQLVALRFLQGMAACVGTSTARAIIRDRHSGHQAARLMAFSFLVIGLSPVVAPLLGNMLLLVMDWRSLFLVLSAGGAIAALSVILALPETLPPERRTKTPRHMVAGLVAPLRSPAFLGWTLVAGLATMVPFSFVTAAPFLYTRLFALTGDQYTFLLGLNAICSIAATQLAPVLMRRWGVVKLTLGASALAVSTSVVLAMMPGEIGLPGFQAWSILMFIASGLILTPAATSAFDAITSGAGAATGLLGTLQLAVTAFASALISLSPSASTRPLALLQSGGFVIAFIVIGAIALFAKRPQSARSAA